MITAFIVLNIVVQCVVALGNAVNLADRRVGAGETPKMQVIQLLFSVALAMWGLYLLLARVD